MDSKHWIHWNPMAGRETPAMLVLGSRMTLIGGELIVVRRKR
jgi:hypothetical protein